MLDFKKIGTHTLANLTIAGTAATILSTIWPGRAIAIFFLLIFVIGEIAIIFINKSSHLRIIRHGLQHVVAELHRLQFKPEIIFAFSRSGSIAAGMIAGNLGLDNVIVITRKRVDETDGRILTRIFEVPNIISDAGLPLRDRRVLVMSMVITTGETYDASLRFLAKCGVERNNIRVASILIQTSLATKRPDIIFYKIHPNPSQFIETAPWIFERYVHP